MAGGLRLVRCVSCGGTYPPVQGDGSAYYHACPEVRVNPEWLPTMEGVPGAPPYLVPIEARRDERIDPANAEDEDVLRGRKPARMIAEGLGVEDVEGEG